MPLKFILNFTKILSKIYDLSQTLVSQKVHNDLSIFGGILNNAR